MLFLFGNVQHVKDSIAANQDSLQEHQILVPVTRDGSIEDYQVRFAPHLAHDAISSLPLLLVLLLLLPWRAAEMKTDTIHHLMAVLLELQTLELCPTICFHEACLCT